MVDLCVNDGILSKIDFGNCACLQNFSIKIGILNIGMLFIDEFFNEKVNTVLPIWIAIFLFSILQDFLKSTNVPNLELLSKIRKQPSWYFI